MSWDRSTAAREAPAGCEPVTTSSLYSPRRTSCRRNGALSNFSTGGDLVYMTANRVGSVSHMLVISTSVIRATSGRSAASGGRGSRSPVADAGACWAVIQRCRCPTAARLSPTARPSWKAARTTEATPASSTADERNPKIASTVPMPVPTDGVRQLRRGGANGSGRTTTPDLTEPGNDIVMAYFNAGLRVFDISDPYQPVETAWCVSEQAAGAARNPAQRAGHPVRGLAGRRPRLHLLRREPRAVRATDG